MNKTFKAPKANEPLTEIVHFRITKSANKKLKELRKKMKIDEWLRDRINELIRSSFD